MLLTMQGDGQVGDSTSFINAYGPHYWLANGWNGSVQLGNGTHYPLLVTVQQWAVNTRPMMVQQLLDSLFKEFHPRSVAMAGLDGGVEVFGWYMLYCQTTGNEKNMQNIKGFVDLEGVTPVLSVSLAAPWKITLPASDTGRRLTAVVSLDCRERGTRVISSRSPRT
jgi:hypothetical protein